MAGKIKRREIQAGEGTNVDLTRQGFNVHQLVDVN